jgi:hypothetical protein
VETFDQVATIIFWVLIPVFIIWQWVKSRKAHKQFLSMPKDKQEQFKKIAPFNAPLLNAYAAPMSKAVLVISVFSILLLIMFFVLKANAL